MRGHSVSGTESKPTETDADLTAAGLSVGARKRVLQAIEGLRDLSDTAMQPVGSPRIVPTEPATEAERRQLTVLFCDVVGSTHLAETLDPEDLRNLLLSFQKVYAEVVQRHKGQIGLFIGDGVNAYFGYPRGHEDSAQRAVQAGLDILAGLTELRREGLEGRCGVRLGLEQGFAVADSHMGAKLWSTVLRNSSPLMSGCAN